MVQVCISTFAVCILTSRWRYLYLVGTQELLQSDLTHLTTAPKENSDGVLLHFRLSLHLAYKYWWAVVTGTLYFPDSCRRS